MRMVAKSDLGFSRSSSASLLFASERDSKSPMSAGWSEKNAVSLLEINAEAMRSRHSTTNPMMALTVNPVKKLFETTVSSPMRGSGSGVSKAVCFMIIAAKVGIYSDMRVKNPSKRQIVSSFFLVLWHIARWGGFGGRRVGLAIRRLRGGTGGSQLHHFVGNDFGDVADDALLVGVLSGPELTFHIHHVALRVVATPFGDVVGQIAPNDDVVPVGLFHPVLVAVAIAFGGGHADRYFLVSVVKRGYFGVFS